MSVFKPPGNGAASSKGQAVATAMFGPAKATFCYWSMVVSAYQRADQKGPPWECTVIAQIAESSFGANAMLAWRSNLPGTSDGSLFWMVRLSGLHASLMHASEGDGGVAAVQKRVQWTSKCKKGPVKGAVQARSMQGNAGSVVSTKCGFVEC